jgi:putative ABC transport system permease protein
VVSGTTLGASAAAGVALTVGAALVPALAAARVPPMAALRHAAGELTRPSPRRILAGALLAAAGIALLGAGMRAGGGGLSLVGLGAVLATAGTVALGPAAARPAARALGAPLAAAGGLPGALARQNARRNPRRTAAAATALMVGVAVVTLFTVFAASLQRADTTGLTEAVRADIAVTAGGFGSGGIDPQLVSTIAALPGIGTVSGLGRGQVLIGGQAEEVSIVDPATIGAVLDLAASPGSIAGLQPSQLAVSARQAAADHWRIGSPVVVTMPDGTAEALTVGAIYGSATLAGDFVLPEAAWAPHSIQSLDRAVFVRLPAGTPLPAALAAVRRSVAPYAGPTVEDRTSYLAAAGSALNVVLGIVYVLLALAIVIAVLGIANTLSLAVHERTREIGLLRAVGQTRRQLRSMIRLESVIVALFGAAGGMALGVAIGSALAEAAGNAAGLTALTIPAGPLIAVAVLAGIAGLLAAIRPARRAARLPLLAALAEE